MKTEKQIRGCISYKAHTSGLRKETFLYKEAGQTYSVDYVGRCGYCAHCRMIKSREWIVRNFYESRSSGIGLFITLTYNDSNLKSLFLNYADFQKYMKRLRKRTSKIADIRYHCVGHYGKNSGRPHFHVMIYADVIFGHLQQFKNAIDLCWSKGFTDIQVSDLTAKNISYISLHDNANYPYKELFKKVFIFMAENRLLERLNDFFVIENEKVDYMFEKVNRSEFYVEENFNGTNHTLIIYPHALKYVRSFIYHVRERILCSKGLGYTNFEADFLEMSALEQKNILENGVFINGSTYRLPSSWIKKLCKDGHKIAIEFYKKKENKDFDEGFEEHLENKQKYLLRKSSKKQAILDGTYKESPF